MDDKVLSRMRVSFHIHAPAHTSASPEYTPRPLTIGEAPHTYSMRTLAQYVLPTISSKATSVVDLGREQKHAELDVVFHFELMLLDAAREGNVAPPMATGDGAITSRK